MERTRYIRRGDYKFTNTVTTPLVIEEINSNENLTLRMMTSMLRHHTILSRPLKLIRHNSKFLNWDEVEKHFEKLVKTSISISKVKILARSTNVDKIKYNPVGYVLSSKKDLDDEKLNKRQEMIDDRFNSSIIEKDKWLLSNQTNKSLISPIKIKSINIEETTTPLNKPYKLSFTTINSLKTINVFTTFSNNKVTHSEVVPLLGYSTESYEEVLNNLHKFKTTILNKSILEARNKIDKLTHQSPFSTSAILTGIDLLDFSVSNKNDIKEIKFVIPISTNDKVILFKKNTTYKIKLSGNLDQDLYYFKSIMNLDETVKLRIDGNQSYDYCNSKILLEFLSTVSYKKNIEFLEQPLKAEDWNGYSKLLELQKDISILLDESIISKSDVNKAQSIGITHIKLKLFKQGGIKNTLQLAHYAHSLNMKIVIGNGVASEICNDIENTIYLKYPHLFLNVSEANGMLKL